MINNLFRFSTCKPLASQQQFDCIIKGSRKNNLHCLGVDPSHLAALLVLSIQRSMRSPRALPDRHLSTQTGEVILARTLSHRSLLPLPSMQEFRPQQKIQLIPLLAWSCGPPSISSNYSGCFNFASGQGARSAEPEGFLEYGREQVRRAPSLCAPKAASTTGTPS